MKKKIIKDKDYSIPLYQQLKEIMLDEWKELSPLTPIPSERELCDKYDVSRPTVRRALEELQQDGEIYRLPGKGTFVAEKEKKYIDHAMQWFIGFYEDASMQHKKPNSRVLQQTVGIASADVANKLNIPEGTEIFILERLRFLDKEPMCLVTSYLPLTICPDLIKANFSDQSLYEFLNQYDISIYKAKRSIEVIHASTNEATYLEIEKDSPVTLFQSLGFTEDGIPFEYVRSRYPAYKARFESEVFKPND